MRIHHWHRHVVWRAASASYARELTRAITSDIVFYGMICMYLAWSMTNNAPMAYYIALLGAIAAGVLPTLSMARIISKGRR